MSNASSMPAMVKDMDWDSLEQRRKKANVTFIFEAFNQLIASYSSVISSTWSNWQYHQTKSWPQTA
jgi:hypothetical protein